MEVLIPKWPHTEAGMHSISDSSFHSETSDGWLWYLNLGHLAGAFIQATNNNYSCQEKEKQQYITVNTVRMFIETSGKNLQSLGNAFPVYNKDS